MSDQQAKRLKDIVKNLMSLEADKDEIAQLTKLLMLEAKRAGLDPSVIMMCVKRMRTKDRDKLMAREDKLNDYMISLDMWQSTPLAQAADQREADALTRRDH